MRAYSLPNPARITARNSGGTSSRGISISSIVALLDERVKQKSKFVTRMIGLHVSAMSLSVHQLYKRLETVGKGAYGSVHKGLDRAGNIVALKIINLDIESDDVGDIQREVALLTQLRDAPNITKYFNCHMDGPRVWIVMEFAQGGSALALMKASKDGCLEEKYVNVIIREVLIALSYLHKVPVIHRDIKAANVLVTATGKVMICDFGVSALLTTAGSKRNTMTGASPLEFR
jgi:serine/threonine protein kinase